MNTIRLSIIIAAYNVSDYLLQTITSALQETNFSKEVIIINDGSTDQTGVILDNMLKHYPHLIVVNQANQGLSAVRNLGIKRARGIYILFVDGDDFLNLSAIDSVMERAAIDQPEIVAMPHIDLYSDAEVPFGFNDNLSNANTSRGYRLLSNILGHRCYNSGVQFYLWKKSFLVEELLSFTPSVLHEDIEFTFIAFLRAHHCYYSNQAIYYYRRNRPGSITNRLNTLRITSIAQILPSMVSELFSSPATNNKTIKNHIAAICFDILHAIALEADSMKYLNLFKKLNLIKYIETYSCSGRYKLAAGLLNVLGCRIYCFCYRLLYFSKRASIKGNKKI